MGEFICVAPSSRVGPFGRVEQCDCVSTSRLSGCVGLFVCVGPFGRVGPCGCVSTSRLFGRVGPVLRVVVWGHLDM